MDAKEKIMVQLGLTEDDFKPVEINIAEEAYLLAEYNKIILEMMMEE